MTYKAQFSFPVIVTLKLHFYFPVIVTNKLQLYFPVNVIYQLTPPSRQYEKSVCTDIYTSVTQLTVPECMFNDYQNIFSNSYWTYKLQCYCSVSAETDKLQLCNLSSISTTQLQKHPGSTMCSGDIWPVTIKCCHISDMSAKLSNTG